MTTPMPATGENVSVPAPAAGQSTAAGDTAAAAAAGELVDRRAIRILWWKTIAVLVVALLGTVAVVAWQWLAPASGTVAR